MSLSPPSCCRYVLWLLLLAAGSVSAQNQIRDFMLIDEVEHVVDDKRTPPPPDAPWEPLQLPLGDRTGDPETADQTIWMRFTLERPDNNALHSLYFYRHNLSQEVFFNGEKIGGDTFREGRQTVSWNHPLLVDIQNANWMEGSNTVQIRFSGSYYGGTFAPIVFGEHAGLLTLYEQRLFRQVRINEWLQFSGIIGVLIAFVLWFVRRQDFTYLLFAGMTICWTVLTTHMVMYYSVIDYRYWLVFLHINVDLFGLFLYCFLVRHMNLPSPRGERFVKLWAAIALLWHLLAPVQFWWMGAYGFHFIGNLFIVYLLGRLIAKALHDRDGFSVAISLTILVQLGLFGHDVYMVMFAEAEDWESAMYYSQFAFPLLLLVFLATLLHRFVSALNQTEDLNRDLEAKVEASRVIIERSYAERRELELAQATERERLAIYRDLHDDVGSKLLSIVHTGRDSRLGELARTALESLRNAVSRANSPNQRLPEFIAELREEAQLRLEGSGHRFVWTQSGTLPDSMLESDAVFNLNQVFRELVSNIIRHADASAVTITLDLRDTGLYFTISDNGRGLDSESLKGNGLNHVHQRVAELQGTLKLDSAPHVGVTVQLRIPMNCAEVTSE